MNISKDSLPWLIPLIFSIMFGGFQIWSLVDRVALLEKEVMTEGRELKEEVHELEYRIERIEEFCCSEIKTCE